MRNKRTDIALIIFCLLILAAFVIFAFLQDCEGVSEEENRKLASFPRLTARSLTSGEYFKGISAFVNDNFPLRTRLIEANALMKLAVGQRESNGVFVTKDNGLIAKGEYDSLDIAKKNIEAINEFCDITKNENVAIIPRACDLLSDSLPQGYDVSRSQEINRLIADEIPDALKLKKSTFEALSKVDQPFYRTDHHWTTEGAFSAYKEITSALGHIPHEKEYFTVHTASTDFSGTLASKSSIRFLSTDSVELYRYEGDEDYIIYNSDTDRSTSSFYELSALEEKDKYKVFLGGNFSLLTVRDSNSAEKPRLLLIKDSFANSLVPFLALHFDIDIVDPRYCAKPVCELVTPSEYDSILFIFAADTLATTPMYNKIKPS